MLTGFQISWGLNSDLAASRPPSSRPLPRNHPEPSLAPQLLLSPPWFAAGGLTPGLCGEALAVSLAVLPRLRSWPLKAWLPPCGSLPAASSSGQGSLHNIPLPWHRIGSFHCSSAQACPTLCDPMDRSTPGLPVHHRLPGLTQTHCFHLTGNQSQFSLFSNRNKRKFGKISVLAASLKSSSCFFPLLQAGASGIGGRSQCCLYVRTAYFALITCDLAASNIPPSLTHMTLSCGSCS